MELVQTLGKPAFIFRADICMLYAILLAAKLPRLYHSNLFPGPCSVKRNKWKDYIKLVGVKLPSNAIKIGRCKYQSDEKAGRWPHCRLNLQLSKQKRYLTFF